MNILTDTLPESLEICCKNCPVRSDFKTWIKVSRIMFGGDGDIEKMLEVLRLVFYEIPPNLAEAMRAVIWFLSPPREEARGGKNGESVKKRVFDYDFDAELIYSAFLQQYNIDLCTADLHWWQFRALFDNLTEETQFIKIVQFRSVDLAAIKDKEQRKHYRKMKNLYKLPDNRTQEQKEKDFNESISALF